MEKPGSCYFPLGPFTFPHSTILRGVKLLFSHFDTSGNSLEMQLRFPWPRAGPVHRGLCHKSQDGRELEVCFLQLLVFWNYRCELPGLEDFYFALREIGCWIEWYQTDATNLVITVTP